MTYRALYSLTRPEAVRILLGFAAFLIYASVSLLAKQTIQVGDGQDYAIERVGMASAISNIVYGAPVATVYRNLFNAFEFSVTPVEVLIPKAEHKQIEPGELIPYVPDGIGIGQAVFTTVAMRAFGIHTWSIVLLFLLLMGATTLIFLARFHDQRSVAILAVFLALTIMFASPLGADFALVTQVPVGGYRYFSMLAAIPCLHIVLELIDLTTKAPFTKGNGCLLALQALVFVIANLVNTASIYAYGPVVFAAIYGFIATRGESQSSRIFFGKISIIVLTVGSLLVTFILLTPQAYRLTGRARAETTWHHVIIGFGANPNWPFGNLADLYRGCTSGKPNDSLVPGLTDFNGGCVWADYAKRHGLSENQTAEELYDKNFNIATRQAVFRIFRLYPLQSLMTFVYYKPLMTFHTLAQYFRFSIPTSWPTRILIICQIAVFLAFACLNRSYLSVRLVQPLYFGLVLGTVSTFGLYIVAYSTANTTADLFFYILALISTLIASLTAAVARSFWPSTLSTAGSSAD